MSGLKVAALPESYATNIGQVHRLPRCPSKEALQLDFGNDLRSIVRVSGYHYNLNLEELRVREKACGNLSFASNGAVAVKTGIYTGRSPQDRFIVSREPSKSLVHWGSINRPVTPEVFNIAQCTVAEYLERAPELYIFDGCAGRRTSSKKIRIVGTTPVQHHFCSNMFDSKQSRLSMKERDLTAFKPDFTLLVGGECKIKNWRSLGLNSSTFVSFDLEFGIGLIAGTEYLGEIKKLIFSVLNFSLPLEGVLSMHCSATKSKNVKSENVVLFFGLSGTGKTSLSADDKRKLIGDDEHGWDDDGVFNIEAGCYAKVIDLSQNSEPEIFRAIRRNAILENVVLEKSTMKPDYMDRTITENTRASYSLDHVDNSEPTGTHPASVIFLTCDASGVLPPVAKLSIDQAKYHFIIGYTSKIAGTERGIKKPVPTFSPMFGGAFMPHRPELYAKILEKKLRAHSCSVYLINTGWSGGAYGVGSRFPIQTSRTIVDAVISGELDSAEYNKPDPIFRLCTPKHIGGIDQEVLNPRDSWTDTEAYDRAASKLARLFRDWWKIQRFPEDLIPYGPTPSSA